VQALLWSNLIWDIKVHSKKIQPEKLRYKQTQRTWQEQLIYFFQVQQIINKQYLLLACHENMTSLLHTG
jgi:hypothetical protein